MGRNMAMVVVWFFLVSVFAAAPEVQGGPFDKLKKKIEKKATEKTDGAIDKGVNKAAGDAEAATGKEGEDAAEASSAGEAEAGAKGGSDGAKGGPDGKITSVSTRFDYVPGDKVILLDDFTQDELGEFPAKWRLMSGTFEVADMEGERWLRCASVDGHVRMKVPSTLPEFWTLEFDAYGFDTGSILMVYGFTSGGNTVWETMFPHSAKNLWLRAGEITSSTELEGSPAAGRHHVMFMGRGPALKIYMDRERVASVPDVTASGVTAEFDFRLWGAAAKVRPMITNVRFAEGCRPAKDMLAEGKLVTYGIHFATGSDVVEPDSAPILRQIATYLESKPGLKLKITGHTDNVGKSAANLDLSKRRAAAVAGILTAQFGVETDRFETDGKGDTQPLSANAKPEGRAMNRRVEFAKVDG